MQKRVFITGVAGFIGRYNARYFAQQGWSVIGIDSSTPENALAAGQYLLQAGLAVPMREWLCQTGDIIPLKTEPKDIFNSGMPPEISRCLIAASYKIFPEVTSND